MKVCASTLTACLLALLATPGSLFAQESPEIKELSPEIKQALLQQIEDLEQKLREREMNIDQFKEAFAQVDGLPEGPKLNAVMAAEDTASLRSTLDSYKDDLQEPWPLWMNILMVIAVTIVVILIIMLLCTKDGWFILAVMFLGESGGSGDF